MAILKIVRGLPETGKTSFSKSFGCVHLEPEMYHMRNGGVVTVSSEADFVAAIEWCKKTVSSIMQEGIDVVVSGIFPNRDAMGPYLEMARDLKYEVLVYRMDHDPESYSLRNFPPNIVKMMMDTFEDFDGEIGVEMACYDAGRFSEIKKSD